MAWISILEFCRKKGIKNPQTVYNRIAMRKYKKGKEWREVKKVVKRKEMFYE